MLDLKWLITIEDMGLKYLKMLKLFYWRSGNTSTTDLVALVVEILQKLTFCFCE